MCCTEFSSNGHKIIGDKNVANGFNQFFVNIGPALASNNIPKSNSDNEFSEYLSNMNNMDSMYTYIEPVTEEEILQLVNNAFIKQNIERS